MKIEIKAFDTLFFRDGKPFTMEDESWAEGIFPPPMSVIYGALRAAYFANHPEDLGKANTPEDHTKALKITDIAFYSRRNLYYPVPSDFAVKEEKNKYLTVRMQIRDNVLTSKNVLPLCADPKEDKLEGSSGFYLTCDYLDEYLQGFDINNTAVLKLNEQTSVEPKIGIGRNYNTKTANDGRLYRLGMRRLKDLSFIVGFEGLDLPETGIIRLGGEGKTASYSKCSLNFSRHEIDEKSRRFVVYFKTPVIFENNGYYPDFFDENFACTLNGRKYRIVSMAMDKPLSIGGWDMKTNKPKAMKKFVPAGSVYIVECDSEISLKDFGDDFATKEFCKEEYTRQGYGLYLTGVYND